jgi:hypothetical protein
MPSFVLAAAWLSGTCAENGSVTSSYQLTTSFGGWGDCYIGVLAAIAVVRR